MGIEARVLRTPEFSIAEGQTAYAAVGYALTNTCMYSQRHLPLHLYSIDGCLLFGVGRLSVEPTSARIREVTVSTGLVSLRFAASWQFQPAMYIRPFMEIAWNPLKSHLTYNHELLWGDSVTAHAGVFLGVAFHIVVAQPSAWLTPAMNPDENN